MHDAPLVLVRTVSMRKSLIADLSVGGMLVLTELGLLAFLTYLGLLDPALSQRPLGDSPNYGAMARHPFSSDPAAFHRREPDEITLRLHRWAYTYGG